jgi:hypothetical protein
MSPYYREGEGREVGLRRKLESKDEKLLLECTVK